MQTGDKVNGLASNVLRCNEEYILTLRTLDSTGALRR